jgi:hypothetical protein
MFCAVFLMSLYFISNDNFNIVTCMGVTGFIEHLHAQLVATSNYGTIANLHTLQTTRARAKSSQPAFTSRSVVSDLKNVDSSASMLTSLPTGYYSTATDNLLQLTCL